MKITAEKAGHLGLLAIFAIFIVWFVQDSWHASPTLINMILIAPVALLAGIILIAILVRALGKDPEENRSDEESEGRSIREKYGVWIGCLLLALYVVSLEYIGFDLAGILFCATAMIMLGQRNSLAIFIYSLIVGLAPVYVLIHMMGVPVKTLFLG
ncbi:hypothetical protein GCM10023174_21160 [Chelativorans composti]|jgi:hypothetical protein|uniref:Tripartite tricarboxylate transporter TctB family protein n=1 Tax=Chelativorans composti TaxID=768533 RepID=A0ABW5DKX9_9HYPH